MAQATTIKKQKAQPQTVDNEEAKLYETKAVKAPKLKTGYKYTQAIAILINFELDKRNLAYKLMNKEDKSFTAIVNDSLDLLLYSRGLIKDDEIISEEIRNLIKAIYKPLKHKKVKKQ